MDESLVVVLRRTCDDLKESIDAFKRIPHFIINFTNNNKFSCAKVERYH